MVTLENLGDISAGQQGSVVAVDKDGDIKVHSFGGGRVGNRDLGIVQDGVGSFSFVFVFQELDIWRFVSWEPTVRFGSWLNIK